MPAVTRPCVLAGWQAQPQGPGTQSRGGAAAGAAACTTEPDSRLQPAQQRRSRQVGIAPYECIDRAKLGRWGRSSVSLHRAGFREAAVLGGQLLRRRCGGAHRQRPRARQPPRPQSDRASRAEPAPRRNTATGATVAQHPEPRLQPATQVPEPTCQLCPGTTQAGAAQPGRQTFRAPRTHGRTTMAPIRHP